MQIVYVQWWDIRGETDPWSDQEQIESMAPVRCSTVAHLFSENSDYIKLVGTIARDDEGHVQYGDINIIPAGCILTMTPLSQTEESNAAS